MTDPNTWIAEAGALMQRLCQTCPHSETPCQAPFCTIARLLRNIPSEADVRRVGLERALEIVKGCQPPVMLVDGEHAEEIMAEQLMRLCAWGEVVSAIRSELAPQTKPDTETGR